MSEKHETVDRALKKYFKLFLFYFVFLFVSAASGFVSISAFTSLVGVPANITNPSVR